MIYQNQYHVFSYQINSTKVTRGRKRVWTPEKKNFVKLLK
jgi:hypothetical protein